MKVVILAAGYGTRLLRDLQAAKQDTYAKLVGVPKPLLPIGQLPLISYWVEALKARKEIQNIFVVERLGAVSCLQLAIDRFRTEDHVIVIGGDTLFYEDFHLQDIIGRFETLYESNSQVNLVLSYTCKEEETEKYGILETDDHQKITALLEKPSPKDTASRQACPCFYIFSKHTLPLVKEFLVEKQSAPLSERDAPGNFLSWLVKRKPVYSHHISGRFDVGNLKSYIECNEYFTNKIKRPDYLQ
ncbi:UTP--glucose-1-phosphate uridylyltransferase-like isoform X2 [Hyperolius riggenbachi]|uniref:UTP--glucose-1-phosphate uridylyltransferase-like isoform X2 n=1 Tax=Hyperolius riggenbachi TaxID=752182 RepID=UPI0035A2D1A3